MTPEAFISKWRASELKERSAAQEHFIDLCRLLGEPTPADADPTGEWYCFEKGARKDGGGDGWADVWKRHCFAWEYKGKRAKLKTAFEQLRQYALALDNPPLLIVCDTVRFRIVTNWTNCVSEKHEFTLDDLADGATRDRLKWAMSDPERLRPGETREMVTERAAATFAELARGLRDRGHDPQTVAHFVNRMVFCMFAEDVGLLPDDMFTQLLERTHRDPEKFTDYASSLFGAMATGGDVGFDPVAWFNGGLFDDDTALPLDREGIETALKAATLDWSEIDPSIFGTLFERGLDPTKRSQLGAHYTDRDKIMRIVEPVIVRPLLAQWEVEKEKIAAAIEKEDRKRSARVRRRKGPARIKASQGFFNAFLKRLHDFSVLDPACGSGNFLYLALHALKDIEHRVNLEAEAMGLKRQFPTVGPANVKGMEINAYAAELARVSVWIGDIQWMRRNGLRESRNPILKPLHTIECRDAILAANGRVPDWPEADVVIGNPPFLGGKLLARGLGDAYVSRMFAAWEGRVPREADLVCYWFAKSGQQLENGCTERVGLVATNSIRGGANRRALQVATTGRPIFDAWSNEPWVIDGASVRCSLVCFSPDADKLGLETRLDGERVDEVFSDLTAKRRGSGMDITVAKRLPQNTRVAFMGDTKSGPFDIPGELARQWLCLPENPNGRSNTDVLKPWRNGMDVTRLAKGKWIVDFGWRMSEVEAALYEVPFEYVAKNVRPIRANNRIKKLREYWFRHERPRPDMWGRIDNLSRYIATPMMGKHRLFAWLDARICPANTLIVIARDDDVTFGILHSRFHEAWSLRLGTSLEDRPRYTPTTTFETFPFPDGLSPDIPSDENADDPRAIAIAKSARRLAELRDRWLNPSEWVEWVDEPVPGFPKRPVPRNDAAAKELKARTMTKLYNARPQWLADAHAALDAAVAAAYGWDAEIAEEDALCELLACNRKIRC